MSLPVVLRFASALDDVELCCEEFCIFCSQRCRSAPDICSQRALLLRSAPELDVPVVEVCAIAAVVRIALVSTTLSVVRRSL